MLVVLMALPKKLVLMPQLVLPKAQRRLALMSQQVIPKALPNRLAFNVSTSHTKALPKRQALLLVIPTKEAGFDVTYSKPNKKPKF